MFRDISGTAGRCRSANWTVDFLNVESVTPVTATPEPSALLLAAVGLGLLLASRGRNLRKRSTLTVAILAALATVPLKAQTTNCPSVSGPDYCPVSDFLNGNRALLKIQDIEVIDLGNNASQGKITQLGTSSSSPPTVRQWLRGSNYGRRATGEKLLSANVQSAARDDALIFVQCGVPIAVTVETRGSLTILR